MATETAEIRGVTARPTQAGVEQQGPPLPCPRCTSTNTKFCYYNNYNLSQPRHFCKSCRRYWTQGGTLRDIPVGGGSRKTAKRSRTTSSAPPSSFPCGISALTTSAAANTAIHQGHMYASLPISGGGFTSLLALGGLGFGLDDVGYGGLEPRGVWAFPQHNGGGLFVSSGGGKSENGGGDTWQMENIGLGGGGGVDCYSLEIPPLPELAISTGGSES